MLRASWRHYELVDVDFLERLEKVNGWELHCRISKVLNLFQEWLFEDVETAMDRGGVLVPVPRV